MSTQSFDPGQYKAQQRQAWDASASGWRKWWPTIEQGLQSVSDRIVELAQIQPGQQVLDVATGIGEPAVTAARKVGTTGRVIATDLSPEMLAIGRERAAALGLQNIDFREMDAQGLDLPEDTFNAVLCRMGLMFLPNVATVLQKIRRLLVAGGRLVAVVPGAPEKFPFGLLPIRAIAQELQPPPPPPGAPSLFGLSDVNLLVQTLRQAGFKEVRTEAMTITAEFTSAEAYVRFSQEVGRGALGSMLAKYPAERQAKVWERLGEAAGQYATADGSVRITNNEFILVVGQRE